MKWKIICRSTDDANILNLAIRSVMMNSREKNNLQAVHSKKWVTTFTVDRRSNPITFKRIDDMIKQWLGLHRIIEIIMV